MGFVQMTSDPCLYTTTEGKISIITAYVDDILLAGKSNKQMIEVKEALVKQFEVKDMGELRTLFPGCEHCSGLESRKDMD